jgi:hypothetical protein
MAPNARSVVSALKRMDELGEIATIATGHGPCCITTLPSSPDAIALGAKQRRRQKRLSPCFMFQIMGIVIAYPKQLLVALQNWGCCRDDGSEVN